MIAKSSVVTPTQNVQYLSFILSGYIFGNKDQLCTLANRVFAKLKTSFKNTRHFGQNIAETAACFC